MPSQPGENCYFSVPAPSIDRDNNIIYHQGLFENVAFDGLHRESHQ